MKNITFLLIVLFLFGSANYINAEKTTIEHVKVAKSTTLLGAFFDDVEWQDDFAISNIVGWTSINRNGLNDSDMSFQNFPGKGGKNGFIVYNPSKTEPANTINNFAPHSGSKYYIAVPSESGEVDDWLITNELAPHNGGAFSIHAKFAFDFSGEDKFRVGYSTTNMEASSFTFFTTTITTSNWTKYNYMIPDGAKYISINYISSGYCLLVDDIEWMPTVKTEAPSMVTNIAVNYQLRPNMQATITWTNPSTTVGGTPLTDFAGVKIYRGNHQMHYELITTLTTGQTAGSTGQYIDNIYESEYYSYRIIPYNNTGDAQAASSPLQYFGQETTPGAPRNIVFSRNAQNQNVITWDIVNYGALGGELKNPVTSYKITRSLGENIVTLGTVTTPTITETVTTAYNLYTYSIVANVTDQNISTPTTAMMYSGMSAEQQPVTLGTLESTQPFEISNGSMLTQSIYKASELGDSGMLKEITYFTNFQDGDAGKVRFKLYMSQTTKEVFGTSQESIAWEYYGTQKLVFDGEIDLKQGRNAINIVLDQPFFFNNSENVIITIIKPLTTPNYELWAPNGFNTPITTYRTYYANGYSIDMSLITTPPASWQTSEILSIPSIVINKSSSYASLSGKITLNDNTPVPNATITILPADDSSYQREIVHTNEQGDYNIPAILSGNYKIIVGAIGYTNKEETFTITAGVSAIQNVILDQKAAITITGKVIDKDNQAIANAYINLSGYSTANTKSAVDGTFSITAYAECDYTIEVKHPLYITSTTDFESELNSHTIDDIILTLNVIKPSNMSITTSSNNIVNMTWDAPVGLDNEAILAWGSLSTTGDGYGNGSNEFTSGVRFMPADLNSLLKEGTKLTHIKAAINNNATIYIEIYQGTMAQTLIHSQKEIIKERGIYTFELDKYLSIDKTQELWIAIRFIAGYDSYPMGIDEGPNNPKGSMFKENGTWKSLSLTNKNWVIYGITNSVVETSITGYGIYRSKAETPTEWTELGNTNVNNFSDTSISSTEYGTFNYGVSALYGDISSDKLVKQVNVNMNFNITINLTPNTGTANGAFVCLSNNNNVMERVCSLNDTVILRNAMRGNYVLEVIKENYESTHYQNISISEPKTITVPLKEIICMPVDLTGTVQEENKAIISWNLTHEYKESFENYKDFEKHTISNYILRDVDNAPTYIYTNFTFPGAGQEMAFMVFNQDATAPPIEMPSYDGHRHIVAMASDGVKNNDWLIMPTSSGEISFHAQSTTSSSLEQMIVWYSKTGEKTSDFIKLSEGNFITVPAKWTKYNYTLPEETKYVAINYVTNDSYILLVDNIVFPKAYNHALSYNIYIDGILTKNVTTQTAEIVIPNAINTIEVEAIFASNKSDKALITLSNVDVNEIDNQSLNIYPTPVKDILNIRGEFTLLKIYNLTGKLIMTMNGNSTNSNSITKININDLSNGVYILKAYNNNQTNTYKITKGCSN